MYLKKLTVSEFTQTANDLWRALQEKFRVAHGYGAGESEVRSWKESLPALAEVLNAPNKTGWRVR